MTLKNNATVSKALASKYHKSHKAQNEIKKQASRLFDTAGNDGKRAIVGKLIEAMKISEMHAKYLGKPGELDGANKGKFIEIKTFRCKWDSNHKLQMDYANGPVFESAKQTVTDLLNKTVAKIDRLVIVVVWDKTELATYEIKDKKAMFNFLLARSAWQGQGGEFGKLRFTPGRQNNPFENPDPVKMQKRFNKLAANGHEIA